MEDNQNYSLRFLIDDESFGTSSPSSFNLAGDRCSLPFTSDTKLRSKPLPLQTPIEIEIHFQVNLKKIIICNC